MVPGDLPRPLTWASRSVGSDRSRLCGGVRKAKHQKRCSLEPHLRRAKDIEAFDDIRRRLIQHGAADEFVTDFGTEDSMFFRDPDGLEGEVLVTVPAPRTDSQTPRGTTALRYASN